MIYKRKTKDEFQLVYDYGYGDGPEVLSSYDTLKDAKADKQKYIENEGIYPAIKRRRLSIMKGDSKQCP